MRKVDSARRALKAPAQPASSPTLTTNKLTDQTPSSFLRMLTGVAV